MINFSWNYVTFGCRKDLLFISFTLTRFPLKNNYQCSSRNLHNCISQKQSNKKKTKSNIKDSIKQIQRESFKTTTYIEIFYI